MRGLVAPLPRERIALPKGEGGINHDNSYGLEASTAIGANVLPEIHGSHPAVSRETRAHESADTLVFLNS